MRLLQLVIGDGHLLDLHPNVSVVTGMDADQRAALIEAVELLARGEAVEASGLLEAHGIMFDFEPALVEVIGVENKDFDPVIRPSQLPAQATSSAARALRTSEHRLSDLLAVVAELEDRHARIRQAHEAALAEVERLRTELDEAQTVSRTRLARLEELSGRSEELTHRLRVMDEELTEAQSSLARAQAARVEVETRTQGVRAGVDEAVALRESVEEELGLLDPISEEDARAETDSARALLGSVQAEIEVQRGEDAARQPARAEPEAAAAAAQALVGESAAERLTRIECRLQELDQLLTVLTPVRRTAVEKARAQLVGGDGVSMVTSPEATALADALDGVVEALAERERDGDDAPADLSPVEVRARLDEARQALLEAEDAFRSHDLDPDLVEQLESVHLELVEALERSTSRFSPGSKRAAAQAGALRAKEEHLLDQLGFASYSTYLMGYSLASADPEPAAALHRARNELADAEAAWSALERSTERALALAALRDERRKMLEEARRLLRQPVADGQPQAALRALLVPAVSAQESARLLHDLLEAEGLDLGDEELDHEDLLLMADIWLEQVDQADDRRRSAVHEQSTLQSERAEAAAAADAELAALAQAEAESAELAEEAAAASRREEQRVERLAAARRALADAEQRLAAAAATAERRSELLVDLVAAEELERGAINTAADAEREMAEARAIEDPIAARVEELVQERARATQDLAEVDDARRVLEGPAPDLDAVGAALAAAEATQEQYESERESVEESLRNAEAERTMVAGEVDHQRGLVAAEATTDATPIEELEWYLLARLAAQRSVSMAGSAPMLMDDTLRGFDPADVDLLLGRLERMAEAVQVIVLSDDPVVAAWATHAGPSRAAVVSLQPA